MSCINLLIPLSKIGPTKGILLKGAFVLKLLNSLLASSSLIHFHFFYRTLHILIKALFSRFLSLQLFGLYFLYSFYFSNNAIKLFYKQTKIFTFLIYSFKFSYSFSTLFIKIKLSWLTFESIKALERKTSNSTIYLSLFFFFLIIQFYFLIPAILNIHSILLQNL